jgi:hypothetical protein
MIGSKERIMVSTAKKLAKGIGKKLRLAKKEEKNTAFRSFGLGSIVNHIKTNWVEIKKNVTFTNFIRNRREGFQSHEQKSFTSL